MTFSPKVRAYGFNEVDNTPSDCILGSIGCVCPVTLLSAAEHSGMEIHARQYRGVIVRLVTCSGVHVGVNWCV